MKLARILAASMLICLILVASAQAMIQNPIPSSGDSPGYPKYLETLFKTMIQTEIGTYLWAGYQGFPIYDVTGGDYFNYWIDDQGKILLAGNELQDFSIGSRASTFLMLARYPSGLMPGRMVNSTLYRDVATGSLVNVDYFVTNRMVAIVNGSAIEGTKVYERAVTIGPVISTKAASKHLPLDTNSSFVTDIAPTELWIGNDTTHLRKIGFGGTHPSTQTLELIETIGAFGWLKEHGNFTVRRTINVVDPLGSITGVQLIVDTIIERWRPYGIVEIKIRNGWTDPIYVANVTLGFCSNDHYLPYTPFFWWLKKADGTLVGPTILYREGNATLWSSGGQPSTALFTGFQTPEFAKGYKISKISSQPISKIFFTWDFGHSIQYTVNMQNEAIPVSHDSSKPAFLINPMDKTPWGEVSTILGMSDLAIPDGWTTAMPGSWGLAILALVQYAKTTGNSEVLTQAKQLWNFYYADASARLAPTWITENPSHRPVIYYRSLYGHALAGLMLDASNSTYKTWAQNVIQKAIIEEQDLNPASANYGGLRFGLEEDGWAYALLLKVFQIIGTRRYQTLAHQIFSAIEVNLGYTTDTKATWPPQPASCTAHLPSVMTLNPDGSCSSVYANHPQYVFRSSEMLYSSVLGSTFEGTDSLLLYDSPIMLVAVTNLWKMTEDQGSGKLSVNTRYNYPDDTTGQGNSETQPLGMLALAIWKQQMWNRTVGVYVEKVTGATVTSLVYETTGGNLTVSLKGPNSGSATAKFYYRDGAPSVTFSQGAGSGVYDSATKMYTVTAALDGTGIAVFKIRHPTQPTGPDIAIIAAITGGVSAVVVGIIVVARKRVKR